MLADLFEAFQKEFADLLVPLGEFGGDFVQERPDSVFRERHDPGDDPGRPAANLPGLNGRRRTRDWSGLRIVAVRLT